MSQFADHVVWITGGGSGIGKALAVEFARQGARVAVSGRRLKKLEETVAAITRAGGEAIAVACDVTDEQAIASALSTVVERFGKLDVAVANAGFGVAGAIETLSAEEWRRQFDVNVVGVALSIKHALPHLRETRGRMVLVASVAGMISTPGTGAYCASKYAVRSIGQTLAMELHGSGVSATTIHPGFVESDIARVDNAGKFHEGKPDKRPAQLLWPADKAARVCLKAIWARKREFTFTVHGRLGGFMGRHTPGLVHFVLARTQKRMDKHTSKPN